MKTRWISVVLAALLIPGLCQAEEATEIAPTAATQAFLDNHTGSRLAVDGGRAVALFGAPLDVGGTASTTNAFVAAFLADPDNVDAFGVDDAVLTDPPEPFTVGNGKFKVYTSVQEIEDLEVHGSGVKITVLPGDPNIISYIGIQLTQHPGTQLPGDVKSAQDAIDAVEAEEAFEEITTFTTPEKVIYEAVGSTLHRAWRFRGTDEDDEAYLFFVDTNSGDIVGVVDQVVNADVSGTITGFGTPGTMADNPYCADPARYPVEMPMVGIKVWLTSGGEEYTTYTVEDVEGDASYEFPGRTSGDIESWLIGEWVTVMNKNGGQVADLVVSEDSASGENVDLVFNPLDPYDEEEPWPDPLKTAQVNAFLAIQKTHKWFTELQPTFDGIDQNLTAFVNFSTGTGCNALYVLNSEPPEIHFLVDDGLLQDKCHSSAFSTIATHEYGHFIVEELLPYANGVFHEGAADVIFSLMWNDECLAEDWRRDDVQEWVDVGQVPCLRNMDGAPENYHGFGEECEDGCNVKLYDSRCYGGHCKGLALAGAFWDLRKELMSCSGDPEVDCFDDGDCDMGDCTGAGTCSYEPLWICDGDGDCDLGVCVAGWCDDPGTGPYRECSDDTDCDLGVCVSDECENDPGTSCTVNEDCDLGTCSDDWKTEELFTDFLFITDGNLDHSVLIEVLTAADTDGDLSKGTPDCDKILCAFVGDVDPPCEWRNDEDIVVCSTAECPSGSGHGWSCPFGEPDGSVMVSWDGPIGDFAEPVEGVDYTVNYEMYPPNVVLTTTQKDERDVIKWFVSRYFDGECDESSAEPDKDCNGEEDCPGGDCVPTETTIPMDLGTVFGDWDDTVDVDIIVEVGTVEGELCQNLSVVTIPPEEEDTTWSSVALNLGGDLSGRVQCVADDADAGGLVSGTVTGTIAKVIAEGIGIASDTPGDLESAQLTAAVLAGIPSGSTLRTDRIDSSLRIHGELLGDVEVNGVDEVTGNIRGSVMVTGTGESSGNISMDGSFENVAGFTAINITGEMSGDIVVDADHDGVGTIDGKVIIGVLSGSIQGGAGIDGDITITTLSGTIESSVINGDVNITDDITVTGQILATGDITGVMTIDDDMDGQILASGDIVGDITILGDMDGEILADSEGNGTGDITGDITVVGEFDGNICGANLTPGQTLPEGFDFGTIGANATLCGEPLCPDTYELRPPAAAYPPYNVRKNRYVSFHPNNCGEPVAFKVEYADLECSESSDACNYNEDCWFCEGGDDDGERCTSGADCAAPGECVTTETCELPYGSSWELLGWVGVPDEPNDEDLPDTYRSLVVGDMPEMRVFTELVVHIGDCEIQPVHSYALSATNDGLSFSEPLIVGTILEPYKNSKHWADVVGGRDPVTGLYTEPNERLNVDDLQAIINSINNKSFRPHITVVDLSPEVPDFNVNVDEVQLWNRAFNITEEYPPYKFTVEASGATDPTECPGVPQGRPTPPGDPVAFSVDPLSDLIETGEPVIVDVYIDPIDDLSAYEVSLDSTGGTSGELILVDITIDKQREDYVFGTSSVSTAVDVAGGRASAAMNSGGVEVTEASYAATYTYQASGGAVGVFTLAVRDGEDDDAFLNNSDSLRVASEAGDAGVIGFGVDCMDADDCDDADDCTSNTCVDNECLFPDASSGTSCSDGLYCTRPDQCDGNGNCVGGGGDPCKGSQVCCELGNFCVTPPQTCGFPP